MLVSQVYRAYFLFTCLNGVGGVRPDFFFPIDSSILYCFISVDCCLCELSPSRGYGYLKEVKSNVTGVDSDALDSKAKRQTVS